MKKNYFLAFLLAVVFNFSTVGQDLIITGIFDGSLSGGTPKGIELYVINDIADLSIYGIGSANNGGGTDGKEFTFPADQVSSGSYIYVTANVTEFNTFFGFDANYNAGSALGVNGDDAVELFLNDIAIDVVGDINTDGSGESWDYQDGWAYRKNGKVATTTFLDSDWIYSGVNGLEGGTNNATANSPMPIGTYSTVVSTAPTLAFTSPNDGQVFSASIQEVGIMFSIDNFSLSGDAGGGVSDNSGDGFIKGSATKNGNPEGDVQNIFSLNGGDFNLEPGSSYTLTAELVDNSGASLNPKVEVTVAFSVSLPCDIQLGTVTSTCDDTTSGLDTYSISIPFTGGNTSTYTLNSSSGTIGGDDPTQSESGTITITGITEGTDVEFTLNGDKANSSCELTRNISSPVCLSLPIYEPFDYQIGASLISNPNWKDASTSSTPNDIQVVANNDGGGNLVLGSYYTNNELPAFTGNMISLSGGGSDPFIGFENQTDFVLASFTFSVTDMSNFQDEDGGYFAVLTEGGAFRARVWIKDPTAGSTNEGLNFQVGLSTTSGNTATFNTNFTGNIGEPVFVVVGFDIESDEAILWVNPDPAGFGDNKGTPTTDTVILAGSSTSLINRFLLRQDSSNETPSINIDELRIGTDWAQVTSETTASTKNNSINGFTLYPNPVSDNQFTIGSASSETKQVSIFNVLGKQVFNTSFTGISKSLQVALSSGVYVLKVTEKGKVATQKLIIK